MCWNSLRALLLLSREWAAEFWQYVLLCLVIIFRRHFQYQTVLGIPNTRIWKYIWILGYLHCRLNNIKRIPSQIESCLLLSYEQSGRFSKFSRTSHSTFFRLSRQPHIDKMWAGEKYNFENRKINQSSSIKMLLWISKEIYGAAVLCSGDSKSICQY